MAKLSERHATIENAAIAQSVERILGKDEVASSNLASSSKASEINRFQRLSIAIAENQLRKVQIRQSCENSRLHPFVPPFEEGMRSEINLKPYDVS